jgi:HAD superfamily hydrolase (TIGR01490 family)
MENIFSNERDAPKEYIVFFDLDKTLSNSISGKALVIAAYRKGLLSRWKILSALVLSIEYRLNLRDQLEIIDNMVSWVKGIPQKSIEDLCTEVFNKVLFPSIYKEAISEIKLHRTQNAKIVILSSALTPVCRQMSENLNIDDIICSDLEVNNGFMTGRPLGHLCFGEEKAIRLKAYCDKYNFPLAESWYYGDSISDLHALCVVGNPVCVNPDHKLKKVAESRGWKILRWNT